MIEFVSWISELRLPLLIGYSCCAIVLTCISSVDSDSNQQRVPSWFAIVSLAVLVALRFPTIFMNVPLNPDEAQFLASAIKFRANMNTWLSVDTTSSGPANIYPLMWPFVFGADTGFAVARITAIALLGGTWLLIFSALASTARPVRICLGACLILFLGGTQVVDFTHYSSELVPAFLLMCAMRVILIEVERPLFTAQIYIAGLCLGLVPFAKLQATIIAAGMGLVFFFRVVRQSQQPYRSGSLLLFSASLPGLLLLLPLAIAGGLSDFWSSYIAYAINTAVGEDWGKKSSSNEALIDILNGRFIRGYVLVMAISTVLALMLPIKHLATRAQARLGLLKSPIRCGFALVFLGLSIWAVMVPARPFPHYAFFILWPATLVAGMAWSLATPWGRLGTPSSRLHILITGISSIVILLGLAVREPRFSYDLEVTGAESIFTAGQLLASPDAKREHMLIWGWMPEWYVWSGWTPATRDMHTLNQIWPTPLRGYFRNRLMNDLQRNPPEYIVDAVASESFGFNDPENYGISSFPELASFVLENYELLSRGSPSCPRVFARKSTANAIEQSFAKPSRVYASSERSSSTASNSASRIVDGVVFESCPDAWRLENGEAGGEITLELENAQTIATIEILNTRGGGERAGGATKVARVMAYNGGELIMEYGVQMPRFPYWAQIDLPDGTGSIDRLVVRVETYAGIAGGLNEIRLRKRR